MLEGHDFAVQNHLGGKTACSFRDLAELRGHPAQIARENLDLFPAPMQLRANAVELVFDVNYRLVRRGADEARPDRFRRRLRTREHAFNRTEERQLGRRQLPGRGETSGLADIAEQHVRFLHVVERRLESARDRFFDETFAQADAEIAGQDFHEVLRFERREFREARLQGFGFRDRAAHAMQFLEKLARFA